VRYFLAKAIDGPALIVAERIDEIAGELERRGWADQFHPSYTRMVPAHHVTTLRLIRCPDPKNHGSEARGPVILSFDLTSTFPHRIRAAGHSYITETPKREL
jgi:hypothetical protein